MNISTRLSSTTNTFSTTDHMDTLANRATKHPSADFG